MSLWRSRRSSGKQAARPAKPSKPGSDIWTDARATGSDIWTDAVHNVKAKMGIDLDAVVQQAARGAAEKAVEMAVTAVIAKMGAPK